MRILACMGFAYTCVSIAPHAIAQKKIIHDAEYYIIEAQNGKEWAVEDGKLVLTGGSTRI